MQRFNKEAEERSGSDLNHRDKSLSNNRWPGSPDAVVTTVLQGLTTKLESEASFMKLFLSFYENKTIRLEITHS